MNHVYAGPDPSHACVVCVRVSGGSVTRVSARDACEITLRVCSATRVRCVRMREPNPGYACMVRLSVSADRRTVLVTHAPGTLREPNYAVRGPPCNSYKNTQKMAYKALVYVAN
jgi:hypothetical protein